MKEVMRMDKNVPVNEFIGYYERLQALEVDYRTNHTLDFPSKKQDLEVEFSMGRWERDAIEYVHHTAFNAGYREGFALAKKQGENALHAATEILRCSEERVEMLEDSLSDFIY